MPHTENGTHPASCRKSKKVAIVGAGPAGLVCARECIREGHDVRVFEQRGEIGGTWHLEAVPPNLLKIDALSTEWREKSLKVHSSMYESLRTNVPREMMGFTDFPFDGSFPGSKDHRRFCSHQEVRSYLEAFADHYRLRNVIQFNTSVLRIGPTERTLWNWDVEVFCEGDRQIHRFDAVVIANGRDSVPCVPKIAGLEESGLFCAHSHLYRNAKPYKDKTVAVLGNASSGRDLALEIGNTAKDVFFCGRSWGSNVDLSKPMGPNSNIHRCLSIKRCVGKGQIELEDGRILTGVDALVFCTGYERSYQFFEENKLVRVDKHLVYPLYNYMIHARHPSLAFTTILIDNLPFVFAEYQSKYIARVFSERCQLPSTQEMLDEVDNTLKRFSELMKPLETCPIDLKDQFAHMSEIVKLCGDVKPLALWRTELNKSMYQFRADFPYDFRDRPMHNDHFADAEQELQSVREAMP